MNQAFYLVSDCGGWVIPQNSEGLWRQILMAKYGALREGWEFPNASHKTSAIWKGIFLSKRELYGKHQIWCGSRRQFIFGLTFGWGISHWQCNFRIFSDAQRIRRLIFRDPLRCWRMRLFGVLSLGGTSWSMRKPNFSAF